MTKQVNTVQNCIFCLFEEEEDLEEDKEEDQEEDQDDDEEEVKEGDTESLYNFLVHILRQLPCSACIVSWLSPSKLYHLNAQILQKMSCGGLPIIWFCFRPGNLFITIS